MTGKYSSNLPQVDLVCVEAGFPWSCLLEIANYFKIRCSTATTRHSGVVS
jgi:hypothetical protein